MSKDLAYTKSGAYKLEACLTCHFFETKDDPFTPEGLKAIAGNCHIKPTLTHAKTKSTNWCGQYSKHLIRISEVQAFIKGD